MLGGTTTTSTTTNMKLVVKNYVPGSGLVAAMTQVPLAFFKNNFSLESPELWSTELSTACVGCTADDVEAPVDRLTSYLDIVESHLLKEIEARHEAFFAASAEVQHLRSLAFDLHKSVSSIKATTHGMRMDTEEEVEVSEVLQREGESEEHAGHAEHHGRCGCSTVGALSSTADG